MVRVTSVREAAAGGHIRRRGGRGAQVHGDGGVPRVTEVLVGVGEREGGAVRDGAPTGGLHRRSVLGLDNLARRDGGGDTGRKEGESEGRGGSEGEAHIGLLEAEELEAEEYGGSEGRFIVLEVPIRRRRRDLHPQY